MHKNNLAIWLPWREKEELEAELAIVPARKEEWVQEEHKLANELARENERPEEKLNRLLRGMDIKRSVL